MTIEKRKDETVVEWLERQIAPLRQARAAMNDEHPDDPSDIKELSARKSAATREITKLEGIQTHMKRYAGES